MIKKTPCKGLPLERKHTKWICGKLKVNQGSAFPSETPPSSDRHSSLRSKIPGASQNLSEIAKPVKNAVSGVVAPLGGVFD